MKLLTLSSCALFAAILATPTLAQETRSRSTTVVPVHAEHGSLSMRPTSSNQCPEGESGIRRQVFTVDFARPFRNANYAVTLGLRTLDAGPWVRISTTVQARTASNMTVVAETWCTTTIASAVIDYMAVGE
jgi:hypothetical protein